MSFMNNCVEPMRSLPGSRTFISQQERLIVHLGAEGRRTEHAAGLLTSFREAEAAVAAYRQDLNARGGKEPALPKNEVSDVKSEIPVTYL
jgi:hypothetical protein